MSKLVKCKVCGNEIAKSAKICPYCGVKNKRIPLIFIVFLLFFFGGMINLMGNTLSGKSEAQEKGSAPVEEETEQSQEAILAFDERSWNDFKVLYKSHNNLVEAIGKYSDGSISATDFYKVCESAEEYFATASISFNYGKADYQKDYLSPFQSMALSDQMAAKSLMKYLDSFKTSDLSDAEDNIQNAKDAVTVIASNRGKLLVEAGLTDEEIRAKIEEDTADLGE